MGFSLIFAMDENGLIGKGNGLPWHLPADLAHFKRITSGHPVLMGRKTYETIGKPLPNRRNIILSRDPALRIEGCEVVASLEEARKRCGDEEVFVIGGANVYAQTLPFADKLYITRIHAAFDGDTYFPDFRLDEWRLLSRKAGTVDERNRHPHTFEVYERK